MDVGLGIRDSGLGKAGSVSIPANRRRAQRSLLSNPESRIPNPGSIALNPESPSPKPGSARSHP